VTIDNRKRNAAPIKRAAIEDARAAHRLVFRVQDHFLIRNAGDPDHAAWYRVQVEEATA
jgi:hypothetical protein